MLVLVELEVATEMQKKFPYPGGGGRGFGRV